MVTWDLLSFMHRDVFEVGPEMLAVWRALCAQAVCWEQSCPFVPSVAGVG